MASNTDRNAYLQIEIDRTDHVITAVATQGHKTIQSAVVKFQLSFSRDGLHWFDYREDGEVKVKVFQKPMSMLDSQSISYSVHL